MVIINPKKKSAYQINSENNHKEAKNLLSKRENADINQVFRFITIFSSIISIKFLFKTYEEYDFLPTPDDPFCASSSDEYFPSDDQVRKSYFVIQ